MAMDLNAANIYIARVRWRFAKTVPQWRHEYTVRQPRPDLEADFEAFVTLDSPVDHVALIRGAVGHGGFEWTEFGSRGERSRWPWPPSLRNTRWEP